MTKKMLVDATHPEETRVVVVQGTRLEDFDFESAARKQLIGNIYLAKVTRIEPSLQAAFVDYGGNRHGFLAFSEIHPDYYQIPVADRQALLEADAAEEQRAEDADEDVDFPVQDSGGDESATLDEQDDLSDDPGNGSDDPDAQDRDTGGSGSGPMQMAMDERDSISSEPLENPLEKSEDASADSEASADAPESVMGFTPHDEFPGEPRAETDYAVSPLEQPDVEQPGEQLEQTADSEAPKARPARRTGRRQRSERSDQAPQGRQDGDWEDESGGNKRIESVGGEDALDEVSRPRARRRHYKIQEVIKKRQIMLVQILKDERGSKGAALTTYLSIPGRYCVLMPNTARGGGISRKITNAVDRKRLKAVAAELEVPEGMGLIIRTAGANRTKAEIKRDFDYLLRQWETIRELTLRSTAPCLINEEGSIVKRAVRDLYDKDIEIIQVEGEASYREAKDFMRMLMPSHARRVQLYREAVPLFQRHQVEAQLDSMFDPTVRLKSGGYIVINPTEALVSIDVNSGKSTREANIEATALRTNLEAAEEVARQLRLRDLAGLIVIDFIDMENIRNNKAVERKLKDCLASDRANIQIGRISPFGLLEMSRQRLRQGVVETTTRPCGNCHGTGLVRSVDSLALRVLRGIEEECQRRQNHVMDVHVPSDVAIYILNQKRHWLHLIEARTASSIFIIASDTIQSPNFEIRQSDRIAVIPPPLIALPTPAEIVEEDEPEEIIEAAEESIAPEPREKREGEPRRRRGRGRERERDDEPRKARTDMADDEKKSSSSSELQQESSVIPEGETPEEEAIRRKSRRRRRGRGRNRERDGTQAQTANGEASAYGETDAGDYSSAENSGNVLIIPIYTGETEPHAEPAPEIWRPAVVAQAESAAEFAHEAYESRGESATTGALPADIPQEPVMAVETPVSHETPVTYEAAVTQETPVVTQEAAPAPQPLPEAPPGPKRGGWWQRQFGGKA